MDLKDFVVSAIRDISQGVSEADSAIKEIGGLVNPGTHRSDGNNSTDFVFPRTTLNFDIAVSATENSATAGGLKAKIVVVEASLGAEKKATNETVSRLTFSIDVVLPSDPKQELRLGLVKRPRS